MRQFGPAHGGTALVLLSSLVFGLVPLLTVRAYALGANSTTLLLLRQCTVICTLLPAVRPWRGLAGLWKTHWHCILYLSVASSCTSLLLLEAYRYLPTGIVTAIHFTYPTLVMLIGLLVLGQALSVRKLVCVLLCLAGVILLGVQEGRLQPMGVLMAVGSCLTYSLYILLAERLPLQQFSPAQLTFSVELCNALLVGGLYGPLANTLWVTIPPVRWVQLILFAAVYGLLGYMPFLIGIRSTNAQFAAIASTLEPITSMAAGTLLLQEPFSLRAGLGTVLIVAAVILAVSDRHRPPHHASP